jgi:nitrogen-specific signal transduction histidine kinase
MGQQRGLAFVTWVLDKHNGVFDLKCDNQQTIFILDLPLLD